MRTPSSLINCGSYHKYCMNEVYFTTFYFILFYFLRIDIAGLSLVKSISFFFFFLTKKKKIVSFILFNHIFVINLPKQSHYSFSFLYIYFLNTNQTFNSYSYK